MSIEYWYSQNPSDFQLPQTQRKCLLHSEKVVDFFVQFLEILDKIWAHWASFWPHNYHFDHIMSLRNYDICSTNPDKNRMAQYLRSILSKSLTKKITHFVRLAPLTAASPHDYPRWRSYKLHPPRPKQEHQNSKNTCTLSSQFRSLRSQNQSAESKRPDREPDFFAPKCARSSPHPNPTFRNHQLTKLD